MDVTYDFSKDYHTPYKQHSYTFQGGQYIIRTQLRLTACGALFIMMTDLGGNHVGEWDQDCGGGLGKELDVDLDANEQGYLELESILFDQLSVVYPRFFTYKVTEHFKASRLSKANHGIY